MLIFISDNLWRLWEEQKNYFPLSDITYSDFTIKVTESEGNLSDILIITSKIVEKIANVKI